MPLPDLVRRFDISLYRFRTTDLAQAAPGDPPFETVRGDRLVLDKQVTRDAINALALGIVEHLANDHPDLLARHLESRRYQRFPMARSTSSFRESIGDGRRGPQYHP